MNSGKQGRTVHNEKRKADSKKYLDSENGGKWTLHHLPQPALCFSLSSRFFSQLLFPPLPWQAQPFSSLASSSLSSRASHHLLPCFSSQQHGFSYSWSHAWRGSPPPHFSGAASSSNIYKKTALQKGSTAWYYK